MLETRSDRRAQSQLPERRRAKLRQRLGRSGTESGRSDQGSVSRSKAEGDDLRFVTASASEPNVAFTTAGV